jgi:hypothetical protein
MMKKQTAVEWLEQQLFNKLGKFTKGDIDQAKQMEREQIEEAHGDKHKTKSNPDSIVTYGYTYTGEMYYNETYLK